MKKLTLEQRRELNINLEHLENIKAPKVESKGIVDKVEYKLFIFETIFNGKEYVEHFVEVAKSDDLNNLIERYIGMKIDGKIEKKDISNISRFVYYHEEERDSDEIFRFDNVIKDWSIDMRGPATSDKKKIPLKDWAEREGITDSRARQKALSGQLETAKKIGRQWFIDEDEKNIDNRFKDVEK